MQILWKTTNKKPKQILLPRTLSSKRITPTMQKRIPKEKRPITLIKTNKQNKKGQDNMKTSEFRNKEIAFFDKDRKQMPFRGHKLNNSNNLKDLKKHLKISTKKYNSYVTIATYSEVPRFSHDRKQHWAEFKEWIKYRDETITNIDFMLDFDAEPTLKGITNAWQDVKKALPLLQLLIGKDAKYLTIWFSGNKGFHILGKCKVKTTAQDIIDIQKNIAMELSLLCPTIDTTIYDTARLRKLLGSPVHSKNFGTTRVIPIQTEKEFTELTYALDKKNKKWFEQKELTRLNNIKLQL
jgi:hypothetical protein